MICAGSEKALTAAPVGDGYLHCSSCGFRLHRSWLLGSSTGSVPFRATEEGPVVVHSSVGNSMLELAKPERSSTRIRSPRIRPGPPPKPEDS